MTHVRDVVRDEVSKAMKAQGNTISDNVLSAMRSGAVTPVPGTQDVQQLMQNQILRLLNQGQINAAFQQVTFPFLFACFSLSLLIFLSRHCFSYHLKFAFAFFAFHKFILPLLFLSVRLLV